MEREEALEEVCSLVNKSELQAFCILIGGPSNSGKSTLGRSIVNELHKQYKKIAWIDCDVGQPEFTPPCLLSLHLLTSSIEGTPLDHLCSPEFSYFFGAISPKEEIEYYIECVISLFDHYKHMIEQETEQIPLIINTNGWIKGNGGAILSTIVQHAQPHLIIQLLKNNFITAGRNLIDFESLVPKSKIVTVKSFQRNMEEVNNEASPKPTKSGKYKLGNNTTISAREMRELLLLKYFQCDQMPLSSHTPYSVPWNAIRIRFLRDEVQSSMSLYALNGSVVGLCADPTVYKFVGEPKEEHKNLPQYLLSTPICECVGLGIIRGIDPVTRMFYIITPVPLSVLARVNTFMKGHIELPTISLIDGGVIHAPYLCANSLSISDGSGAAPMNKKRKDIPRQRLQ